MGIDIFELPGILLRRWIYVLATAVLCVLLAGAYVTVKKPTYLASTDILIDPQGLSAQSADTSAPQASASQDQATLESQLYVVASREILNAVVEKMDLTADRFLNPGQSADKNISLISTVASLQKDLLAERAGQSYVMTLTLKHRDPAKAADIANSIAEVYLDKVHEARSDASSRASGAFEMQAQDLALRLRKAEEALESFKAKNGIVSTGQQGLVIDQQVEGINHQLISAKAELDLKRANYEQARALTVGSVAAGGIPEALASTALNALRAKYAEELAKANELATALGANHPQMKAARSQVVSLETAIEQELVRIRQSLKSGVDRAEANVAALQKQMDGLTLSSLDTSEAGIRARELQAQVDTLRALYKNFLSRAEELGQRDTVNINNSRVISKAVPAGSSATLTKIIIVVAASLFGLALGSGVAVGRELVSRMFGGRRQVAPEPVVPGVVASAPSAELPVIARIPVSIKGLKTARFSFSNGTRVLDSGVSPLRKAEIAHAVDHILPVRPADASAIILVMSLDGQAAGDLISEIAAVIHTLNFDVLYSSGEPAGRSVSNACADGPFGSILEYRRLAQSETSRNAASGPTFKAFTRQRRQADYVLIDMAGTEARKHQQALLDRAHGILIVADEGDQGKKIAVFAHALEPWKNRMIGTILLSDAA